VQPGQLIGACRNEHIALPADEFGDGRVLQLQRGDQLRITAEQGH